MIASILIIGGILVACEFSVLINAIVDRVIGLRPGAKTFNWWAKPPVEPRISLYVYNVTNADDFLSNGSKAIVDEVGPYVYRYVPASLPPPSPPSSPAVRLCKPFTLSPISVRRGKR